MKRRHLLETIADCEDQYGSAITGGDIRRRDVMRAVRAGLVVSAGIVQICDGDGCAVEPERFAEGFKLTEAGRRLA